MIKHLSVIVFALALYGCGEQPAGPIIKSNECDSNSFFYSFIRGKVLTRTEISCASNRMPSVEVVIRQSYVKYSSDIIEVTYRDNQHPVRVVGAAPGCILAAYSQEVPTLPLTTLDCTERVTQERAR